MPYTISTHFSSVSRMVSMHLGLLLSSEKCIEEAWQNLNQEFIELAKELNLFLAECLLLSSSNRNFRNISLNVWFGSLQTLTWASYKCTSHVPLYNYYITIYISVSSQ
jgi:hypothetical protein